MSDERERLALQLDGRGLVIINAPWTPFARVMLLSTRARSFEALCGGRHRTWVITLR